MKAKSMRQILLVLSLIYLACTASSQGYTIHLKVDSAQDKEVFLAHYYIGNIYVDDTVRLDETGAGTFSGENPLPQGLYKIYLDDKNHFDFLLCEDQEFKIKSSDFSIQNVSIEGAVESEEFLQYMHYLRDRQRESAQLREELKSANQDEQKVIRKKIAGLDEDIRTYWSSMSEKYPDSFLPRFLWANYVPALDTTTLSEEIRRNDTLLFVERFNYQKEHFWDYFDYSDERFLYTPFYKTKLDTWFNKVLYQNYDSVRGPVFEFIENVKPNKRLFQFVTSWFLNSSINSKVMGMDALFVDLANRYYLSGEAFWPPEEALKKIEENVIFFEHNLIGKTAPDLTMEGFDGEYFTLHQIDAKITAVLIFEPNCSHCKVFVPELYKEVYLPFKDKGLEIFAIYSQDNREEWNDFLIEHNLFEWINVWDKDHTTRFKISYDARQTPGLYVLDKDKKIIAKKLSVEQMKQLMEFHLKEE